MATLPTLATSGALPKSGPFPPPTLLGFSGTTSLSATPHGPACPSRASGQVTHSAAGVSRVASDLPVQTCCRHYPGGTTGGGVVAPQEPVTAAFPIPLLGRLPHYAFRGLLGVHSRYGLSARGVAQGDPFHRRLRQYRYLHCRSDCYRLERPLAGWELHPLKIDALARRTKGTAWGQRELSRSGPAQVRCDILVLLFCLLYSPFRSRNLILGIQL